MAEMGDRGHNRHRPKGGGCCAPFTGAGTRLVECGLGRGLYFRTKRRIHRSSHLATLDMGQKLSGVGVPFFMGVAGSTSNTMSRRPRPTSVPSGIFIHLAVWHNTWAKNWGGAVPLLQELGPHLTQCRLGRRLPPYQVASLSFRPFGHSTPEWLGS